MSGVNDLVMPKLGLTMTEGMLSEWRVGIGSEVKSGDILFVVETDKIATEIEAPSGGVIREIVVNAGETVPVGATVGRWTGAGISLGDEAAGEPAKAETPPFIALPARSADAKRVLSTPLARRLARERGLDISQIRGTGPRGRVKAKNVLDAETASTPAVRQTPAQLTTVARKAAQRLTAAKRDIPHFYVSSEAEISELLIMRGRAGGSQSGPKISINDVVVAAAARALHDLPELNRVWSDDGAVMRQTVDIGVAVNTESGLYAPVQRDIGGLGLNDVAVKIGSLIARTREGRLGVDDLAGGVLSVSNIGMFGIASVTPIINPGQSAILGVGALRELFRPDPRGAPALRREIVLTLAADHRVFDGVSAAKLLNKIIHYVEHPSELSMPVSKGVR